MMVCDVDNSRNLKFPPAFVGIPGIPPVRRLLSSGFNCVTVDDFVKAKIWKGLANRLFCEDRNDRKVSGFCVDRKAEHTWNSEISVV